MAYKILKNLISNGRKSNEEILDMADVYYAAKRITDQQYAEIVDMVNAKLQNESHKNDINSDATT